MSKAVDLCAISAVNIQCYSRDVYKAFVEVALPNDRVNLAVLFTSLGTCPREAVIEGIPSLFSQLLKKLNSDRGLRYQLNIDWVPVFYEKDLKLYRVVDYYDGIIAP